MGFGSFLGAVGGLLGGGAAKGDISSAEKEITRNLKDIQNISLPDYQKMIRQYALLQSGKEYSPEQLVAEQMQRDYAEGVQTDPELMAKQRQYLSYLEDIAKQGMTPDEAAQRNALMRSLEASQQAKIADIQRQAEQQGMGSSGASLLAKMTAQQQAQNTASEQAERLAGEMAQRRMGAQGSLAKQAGSLDEAQYARAMQKAEKKQALDEFNLRQRAAAKTSNIEELNAAQRANLARQQQVSDANVALLNKQQDINKELERQKFVDSLEKYGYTSQARKDEAAMRKERAGRTAKEAQGVGKAIGSAGDFFTGG